MNPAFEEFFLARPEMMLKMGQIMTNFYNINNEITKNMKKNKLTITSADKNQGMAKKNISNVLLLSFHLNIMAHLLYGRKLWQTIQKLQILR